MIGKITYLVLGLVMGGGLSVAIADAPTGTVAPWWYTTKPQQSMVTSQVICHDPDANAKLDRILIGLDIQP